LCQPSILEFISPVNHPLTAEEEAISQRRRQPIDTRPMVEKAGLVGCYRTARDRDRAEDSLHELEALAEAAGARVVERVLQERPHLDSAYFIGRGKAEELHLRAEAGDLDLVVFDDELTPGQQRNLEAKIGCKIIDRTQLILDIFARRARTREGKLQVELAQLNYLLPRLAGKGTMLSRLGGGIGTRGPGETKLEMDRRRIRNRISSLSKDLDKIRQQRQLQRAKRQGIPLPLVALVGYTNAGKSTLFNALTRAGTVSSAQLFSTLDPLLRRLTLPSRLEIVISDTVGFVRKLPHDLVAAFRATLEEVRQADLILHVIDVSSPHWREQVAAVEDVLNQLEVQSTPRIEVYNKVDLLAPDTAAAMSRLTRSVAVSARAGMGLDALMVRIDEELESFSIEAEFRVPYDQAGILSRLHEQGRVISETYESDGIRIAAEVPRSTVRSLGRFRVRE
jgi:GTP-binding protein HflX